MNIKSIANALFLSFLTCSISSSQEQIASKDGRVPASNLPTQLQEIMWWIPTDTETLIVDQKPTVYLSRGADEPEQLTLIGMLESYYNLPLARRLGGKKIILQVDAGRRFRTPTHLGLMPCECVLITVFRENISDDFKLLSADSGWQNQTFMDKRILYFKKQIEDHVWEFSLSLPQPNIMVISTHRPYLEDLLKRVDKRVGGRAFPEYLPEWKYLDVTARTWGLRHFSNKNDRSDPTSPRSGLTGWRIEDSDGAGLVFYMSADSPETTIIYVTDNRSLKDEIKRYFKDIDISVKVNATKPASYHIVIPNKVPDQTPLLTMRLAFLLGHGVCL